MPEFKHSMFTIKKQNKLSKKRISVLLIHPPLGYSSGRKPNIDNRFLFMPQSLLYVASSFKKANTNIRLLDLAVQKLNLFKVIQVIKEITPDIIAFTGNSPSFCYVESIAKYIRILFPKTIIIIGGVYATYDYVNILKKNIADIIFLNESDQSIIDYIDVLRGVKSYETLSGVAYLDDNNNVIKKELTTAPCLSRIDYLDHSLVEIKKYMNVGRKIGLRVATIHTSRGCSYSCMFCLNHKLYGNYARFRPIKDVISEILGLKKVYGINHMIFTDPTLTLNSDYFDELCTEIGKTGVTWAGQTRIDLLNCRQVKKMKKNGCIGIFLGIEAGSNRVLSVIKKQLKKSKINTQLEMIDKHGLGIMPSYIIGLPGDTKETINSTIDTALSHIKKFNILSFQINTFSPFPGVTLEKFKDTKIFPIDPAYYPVVPVVYSKSLPYEVHLNLWKKVWKVFFPAYYEAYLEIEQNAFKGENPLLEKFIGKFSI